MNSTADAPDADPADGICAAAGGACTLRAAIMQANFATDLNTITVPSGVYILTRPGYDDAALVGDLDLDGDVTIQGAGPGVTIVDGNGSTWLPPPDRSTLRHRRYRIFALHAQPAARSEIGFAAPGARWVCA